MEWRGNRVHCLFVSLFLWATANALGVWQNRPAHYWQSGDDKDAGDKALALVQQELGNTGSGTANTSSSGDSVANAPGILRQYTISWDQDALNQPQSQGGYKAQLAGPTSDVVSSGVAFLTQSSTNQNQLVTRPVSPSQGSASQSLSSQQSSSLPQSLSSSSSLSSATSQQDVSGFQSAVDTQPSIISFGSQGSSIQASSGPATAKPVFSFQDLVGSYASPHTPSLPGIVRLKPVPSSLSSASSNAITSQQAVSSFQSAEGTLPSSISFGSQGSSIQASSGPATAKPVFSLQDLVGSYASPHTPSLPGIVRLKPVPSSLSSASGNATTSQHASSGFQSAVGTQPSSISFDSQGSSVQASSEPVPSSLSSASGNATTSQHASSGFQSTAITQPASSYFFSQGQRTQIPSWESTNRPMFPSQGLAWLTSSQTPESASLSSASQQSSLQSEFPSLQSFLFPSLSVSGTQAKPPIGFGTASQQFSFGFQAAGAQGTQLFSSSLYSSSQGHIVASSDRPVFPSQGLVSRYIAGPAQWYRVDHFGNRTPIPRFS